MCGHFGSVRGCKAHAARRRAFTPAAPPDYEAGLGRLVSLPPVTLKPALWRRGAAGLLAALCNSSKTKSSSCNNQNPRKAFPGAFSSCLRYSRGQLGQQTSVCLVTANPALPAVEPLLQISSLCFLAITGIICSETDPKRVTEPPFPGVHYNHQPAVVAEKLPFHRAMV